MKHELKILPAYYEAIVSNGKNFEIRDNSDRGFQKGDTVILREYQTGKTPSLAYTGREIRAEITYVTSFQQKDGYVVFGIDDVVEL